jgi:hypothetical protein
VNCTVFNLYFYSYFHYQVVIRSGGGIWYFITTLPIIMEKYEFSHSVSLSVSQSVSHFIKLISLHRRLRPRNTGFFAIHVCVITPGI